MRLSRRAKKTAELARALWDRWWVRWLCRLILLPLLVALAQHFLGVSSPLDVLHLLGL